MDILVDFKSTVLNNNLGVYGIHVYQNGITVAEYRFQSNDRVNLFSGSKTFVAIGIGIAIDEGLVKVDDYILNLFPEYKSIATTGSELIQLENLLMMTSGHNNEEFSFNNKIDRAELFFSTKIHTKPGKSFFYEDLCSYVLGRVVEKVSGVTLLKYLIPRLFKKLDIENPQWLTCQLGHTLGSTGLFLRTEEYSRIGILMLNNGVYNNQRVVSSDFILKMKTKNIDTSNKVDSESKNGYGYHILKNSIPNSYRADGMYGQICAVFENYNAVVTYTGHNEQSGKDALRAVYKDVLPLLD